MEVDDNEPTTSSATINKTTGPKSNQIRKLRPRFGCADFGMQVGPTTNEMEMQTIIECKEFGMQIEPTTSEKENQSIGTFGGQK